MQVLNTQTGKLFLFVTHPDLIVNYGSIFRIPCLDKAAPGVYGRKQNDQVEVELDLDIVDISSLDVIEEEISVEINLIQSWIDTRCRFEVKYGFTFQIFLKLLHNQSLDDEKGYVIFQGSDSLTMWTPDTYISNAVSSNAPSAPKPQKSTRVKMISRKCQYKLNIF